MAITKFEPSLGVASRHYLPYSGKIIPFPKQLSKPANDLAAANESILANSDLKRSVLDLPNAYY